MLLNVMDVGSQLAWYHPAGLKGSYLVHMDFTILLWLLLLKYYPIDTSGALRASSSTEIHSTSVL